MPELVVESLVKFVPQPGTLGILTAFHGNVATVVWDAGVDLSNSVNIGSLARVSLQHPVQHRLTDAVSHALEPVSDDPPRWRVTLPDGVSVVPEQFLRPHQPIDPLSRIRQGQFAPFRKLKLVLTTWNHYLAYRHQDLMTLAHTRVDLKPYQIGVAHRVISPSSYPHRFLLCDEVGLGKTIEAGIILKELRARGLAKRCLVIAPPELQRQWQFELKTKFNETFAILNRETVHTLQNTQALDDENVFQREDSVIVSSRWIVDDPQRSQTIAADWDIIIVDEAHHVRSKRTGDRIVTTKLYDLVAKLAEKGRVSTKALLLLTATPMQLQTHELYSLVELCDPVLFSS